MSKVKNIRVSEEVHKEVSLRKVTGGFKSMEALIKFFLQNTK